MQKFRTGSVVVEAMQFTLQSKDRVYNSIWGNKVPTWDEQGQPALDIATSEGDKRLFIGDWVIREQNGEYAICKDAEFKHSHQPVNA